MRVTFVHIVEQTLYEPGTAALAGVAMALGAEVSRVPADFGSRQEALIEALVAGRPDLILVRVTGELREPIAHAAAKLVEHLPEARLVFHGPLAFTDPGSVGALAPRCAVLLGDPEPGLAALMESWPADGDLFSMAPPPGVVIVTDGTVRSGGDPEPADPGLAPPPAWDLFEPELSKSAIGASLFGEPGQIPLETVLGSPSGLSGNAGLAIFNQPTAFPPRLRPMTKLHEQANLIRAHARAFEVVDREFGFEGSHYGEFLGALDQISQGRSVTLRMLASTANEAIVRETHPGLIHRIATELDAVGGEAAQLPGAETEAQVRPFVELCRERGFETGLLVSVGLPGESRGDIRRKLDFIRELRPEHLRFFPFEPRHGHPWRALCEERSMLPLGEPAWNREVHTPLRQDCLDPEDWYLLWQDCLDLQAETRSGRRRDEEAPA